MICGRKTARLLVADDLELMRSKHCTCGAEADVRRATRRTAAVRDALVYRGVGPVCGQLGPAIPAAGRDQAAAVAEAVAAWDEKIAPLRPPEAWAENRYPPPAPARGATPQPTGTLRRAAARARVRSAAASARTPRPRGP